MANPTRYQELIEHLRSQNLSEEEIGRVIARVEEYELDIQVDSIMESVASGEIDLQSMINEAVIKRT